MNKIILVGHPSSGLQEVEKLLHKAGMQVALPSKREGMSPSDLTQVLCTAHQCPQVDEPTQEEEFLLYDAGVIWHGLALDLMLGNLDRPLWGWADPRNIYWLRYWASLDPHATFVLVYDHPSRALLDGTQHVTDVETSEMLVPRLLENWQAYNGAMLAFHAQHAERCLLVNAQQVRQSVSDYLDKLQDKLKGGHKNSLHLEGIVEPPDASPGISASHPMEVALQQVGLNREPFEGWLAKDSLLTRHLLEEMLAEYPAAMQIFHELQSLSQFPTLQIGGQCSEPAKAWLEWVRQRHATVELVSALYTQLLETRQATADVLLEAQQFKQLEHQGQAQNQQLLKQLQSLQLENEALIQDRLTIDQLLSEQRERINSLEIQVQLVEKQKQDLWSVKKDHAQALTSLDVLIEEKAALLKFKQAEESARLAEARAKEDALAEIDELKKRLAQKQTDRALEEENETLLQQLHHVQEELERYYLEYQRIKNQQTQADAALQGGNSSLVKQYGAADRLKQELPYRLGASLIHNSRSVGGLLRMPFALAGQVRIYKKEKQLLAGKGLAPIDTYADAHEAERCKKHLSYRLGQELVKHGKTPWGWLWLPVAMRRAVRAYKKEREQT